MSASQPSVRQDCVIMRDHLIASDLPAIRSLVEATDMFTASEVGTAVELLCEYFEKGAASGYHFVVAEIEGAVVGYACFGPIPCTVSSWDLYWIAVQPARQRSGVGRLLLREVEGQVLKAGGSRVYLDTAGRDAYEPTRSFYERMGYARAAVLPDFYAEGDAKVVYAKRL